MHRNLRRLILALTAMALTDVACHSSTTNTTSKIAPAKVMEFSNAAPSIDALIDQFLTALAAKDVNTLEQLRVSEAEYLTLILPGSVPEGKPPKNFPDDPAGYYWRLLNTKSMYSLQSLVNAHGGHTYKRKEFAFQRGEQRYAGYTAYKKLSLQLEDEQGNAVELNTGSIAELSGKYKFISYNGH